jgi:bifunctional UDP-N-acetylglucosamine pyrophosphorylase/glucosamine-1-phosphate N-acetyltransferase
VQLLGKTRIGERCKILTGSILRDVRVEDDAAIGPHSVLDASRVASNAVVGPFARLRPGSDVRANAHVGNFVELKKTILREGAKANHLSYLGDATIGSGSNIGAGTITCNYDGVSKHPTTIGSRVFIGSDSALVAPVRIGDGAYVAAGSIITENVPADALAIARGRQVNKPGWAATRRRALAAARKKQKRPRKRIAHRRANPRAKARKKSRRPAKKRRR